MAEKIEVLVEGGKATAAPPLGPKLGEMKMNVGEVISDINQKTQDFKGMKVPVILEINDDKTYTIEVGTPPVSQLIKKELNLDKGSGAPHINIVGNIAMEQVIKISKMKETSIYGKGLKSAVKCVIGSCNAMGVLVEGYKASEINSEVDKGVYDQLINEGKTEVSPERLATLKAQLEEVKDKFKLELERMEAEKEKEKEKEEKVAAAVEEGEEEAKEGEAEEEAKEEKPSEKEEKKKE